MSGEIELDDIEIVNVTGKAHRDKPRKRSKDNAGCWNPSLRVKILIIFFCIFLVFVVAAIILITRMRASLHVLDQEALRSSIDRFTTLIYDDIPRMKPYTRHAAWQKLTAETALALARNDSSQRSLVDEFVQSYLNTSIVYLEDGSAKHVYRCASQINFWGIIHPFLGGNDPNNKSFTTLWYEYHPGTKDKYCTLDARTSYQPGLPAPVFPASYFRSVLLPTMDHPEDGWLSIFPPMRVTDPVLLSIEAIMLPDDDGVLRNKTIYGFLVSGKTVKPHLSTFATKTPGCISMISSTEDEQYFDAFDQEKWSDTDTRGTFDTEKRAFSGEPLFVKRNLDDLKNCPVRYCPAKPLFPETDEMMTGYFTMCGQDPKKAVRNTCIKYRMDRPMSRVEEGTLPVVWVSVLVIAILIILFAVFLVFLDFAVLRRVVKLSKSIRRQTLKHHNASKDLDEDDLNGKKKGKSSGETPHSTGSGEDGAKGAGGDEIKNLKLAVEQNTYRLRKRVEAVNDIAKVERQRILRHKQAMQLLSLWCDRNEFFPGLRPNAVMLRYEPKRSIDDLLTNPLAVEYLKSHCDKDCALENLFFLLDESWLSQLEAAEDNEEDPAKRKLIHDVASDTAATILARYIAEDAPQQINLSAATFKVLRSEGSSYRRGMFSEAVKEIKLVLNMDVLPRFQNSTAYTAMSENLYIDSFANDEDTDFSSDSMSTAGSVLSDDVSVGASHMVAINFKNLYATFTGDSDLASTCTNEMSIIEDPVSPTTTTGTAHEIVLGTGTGTVTSSTKNGSGVDDSSEDSESSESSESEHKEQPAEKKEKSESDSSSSSDTGISDSSSSSSSSN